MRLKILPASPSNGIGEMLIPHCTFFLKQRNQPERRTHGRLSALYEKQVQAEGSYDRLGGTGVSMVWKNLAREAVGCLAEEAGFGA
jgi:hypothetical protein